MRNGHRCNHRSTPILSGLDNIHAGYQSALYGQPEKTYFVKAATKYAGISESTAELLQGGFDVLDEGGILLAPAALRFAGSRLSLFGSKVAGVGVESVAKGISSNPFKGKTFEEIDKILTERGFRKVGPDLASGKGSYFHPKTGRKYYLDKGGVYKERVEMPHVDVHRMKNGLNLESVGKRRYPLGETLIEEKTNTRGMNANF